MPATATPTSSPPRLALGRVAKSHAGHVRLAARSSRRVAFTVSIPAGSRRLALRRDCRVNAADLARPAAGAGQGNVFTIYRISRQALAVTIRLPGPLTRSFAQLREAERGIRQAPPSCSACSPAAPNSPRQRSSGSAYSAAPARSSPTPAGSASCFPSRAQLRRTLARTPDDGHLPRARHDQPEGHSDDQHRHDRQVHRCERRSAQA